MYDTKPREEILPVRYKHEQTEGRKDSQEVWETAPSAPPDEKCPLVKELNYPRNPPPPETFVGRPGGWWLAKLWFCGLLSLWCVPGFEVRTLFFLSLHLLLVVVVPEANLIRSCVGSCMKSHEESR